jgi:DUF4097 and DUF4098 domain-containing protein YvlB
MITTTLLAAALMAAPVQQLDTTVSVRDETRVALENANGSVVVRSWDREGVRIQASNRGAVDINAGGPAVRIESRMRRRMPDRIDYEITVPRRFGVEVEGISLSVEVHGVTGDVTVETVNGGVTLNGVNGRARVETVHGALTVRDSRGNLGVENANGPITIVNHEGEIEAEALNGPVTLTGIRSAAVEAETLNGPIEYGGQIRDGGRYSFSTHAGNITLFVPEGTNAAVSIETFAGEVEADFPIQLRRMGRGEDTSFTLGDGSARIRIEAFGGRIRLRRPGGNL